MRSPRRRRRALAAVALGAGALLACAATAQASGSYGDTTTTLKIKKYLFAPATATTFDFESSLGNFSQQAVVGGYSSGKTFNVAKDVEYTIYELPKPGYEFLPGSSHCSGGDAPKSANWSVDGQGRGVLKVKVRYTGDDVVCNFKNRQVPKLVIKKKLEIGPLDSTVSFPFSGSVAEGQSVSFDAAGVKTVAEGFVPAGVKQSVSETLPAGYAFMGATCDQGVTPSVAGTGIDVTIPSSKSDKTITCTFVNKPDKGKIVVTKNVVNDNGGTAVPGDFTMNVDATDPSQTGFPGDDQGTVVYVTPGEYAVDEADAPGYAKTLGEGCEGTVAAGETKNCVITNDDIAPKLTVIKNVVNDNGGTAVPGDFTMNVTATEPSQTGFPGDDQGTQITLDAGAYSVDEADAPGYAKTLGEGCEGELAIGETAECVITNDDIAPKLTVIKVVDNSNGGGTLTAADFSLQVQREGLGTISFPGSAGTEVEVNAGSYAVTEPDTKGYSAAFSADCSGTIALAESKTCTVTNTSPAPETPQTPETPRPPAVTPTPPPAVEATQTASASLRITKTGPARARVLTRFSYTIRVRNSSRVVATNVVMRDTLPKGLVYLNSAPKATQAGRVLSVKLGDLKPGQVRTIRVNVRAAGSVRGARTNIAVASADNARSVRDSARTVFVRPTVRIIPAVTG